VNVLAHRLTDSIKVAAQSGMSGGNPTFAASTTVKARVQEGRDRSAPEIAHTHTIHTLTEIAASSRIWLPGDAETAANARMPKRVSGSPNPLDGATVWKVLV